MTILILALCILTGYKLYTFIARPFLIACGVVK